MSRLKTTLNRERLLRIHGWWNCFFQIKSATEAGLDFTLQSPPTWTVRSDKCKIEKYQLQWEEIQYIPFAAGARDPRIISLDWNQPGQNQTMTATHQLVPPLDLLLHIVDGEAPDVVAVWVGRDQGRGEELKSKPTVSIYLHFFKQWRMIKQPVSIIGYFLATDFVSLHHSHQAYLYTVYYKSVVHSEGGPPDSLPTISPKATSGTPVFPIISGGCEVMFSMSYRGFRPTLTQVSKHNLVKRVRKSQNPAATVDKWCCAVKVDSHTGNTP